MKLVHGIKLIAISLQEVKFLHTEDIMKFKLIELTSLAVYWDSDVNLVGNLSAKDAVVRYYFREI